MATFTIDSESNEFVVENEEMAYAILQYSRDLIHRAIPIARNYAKLQGYGYIDENEIHIDSYGELEVNYTMYGGYGSYDDISFTIPTSWLFDPNRLEKMEAEIKRKEEEKKAANEAANRARAEAAEAAERNRYLELKAKFGE